MGWLTNNPTREECKEKGGFIVMIPTGYPNSGNLGCRTRMGTGWRYQQLDWRDRFGDWVDRTLDQGAINRGKAVEALEGTVGTIADATGARGGAAGIVSKLVGFDLRWVLAAVFVLAIIVLQDGGAAKLARVVKG